MKTKRCTQCGRVLPVTEFHRRQYYVRSVVRAACKECTHEAAGEAPNDRDELDRLKDQVRAKTHQAIERGELVPEPCKVCGDSSTQADHRRYDGPDAHLDVEWLCQRHHALVCGWTSQAELFRGS